MTRIAELKGTEDQFAVLVDLRAGAHTGMILQHPFFDRFARAHGKLPANLPSYQLRPHELPTEPDRMRDYRDPVAANPEGADYERHWLARIEPVRVAGQDVGWGVIVQESYDTAIGSALEGLRAGLLRWGLVAVAMIVFVLLGMWGLAFRLLHAATPLRRSPSTGQPSERSATATTPTGMSQPRSAGTSGGATPDRKDSS
jgi:hypothetical protein